MGPHFMAGKGDEHKLINNDWLRTQFLDGGRTFAKAMLKNLQNTKM